MDDRTRDVYLFLFGVAIVTGTLIAQYVAPSISPWPGLGIGATFLLGIPVTRAVVRGITKAIADAAESTSQLVDDDGVAERDDGSAHDRR